MHDVYERMEKDGEIGPKEMKDGKLTFRAFAEYPKQITNKAGVRQRVNSLAEEMEATGPDAKKFEDDPLRDEKLKLLEREDELIEARKKLEAETAKMKAKLSELNPGGEAEKVEASKAEDAQKAVEIAQEIRKTEGPLIKAPDMGAGKSVGGKAEGGGVGGLLKSVK